jgi:glutathione synthase
VHIAANRVKIGIHDPEDFALIWLLGFGRQVSYFDRMQILRSLPQQAFVVGIDALTYLHGKHRWLEFMPETHTSSDSAYLQRQFQSGGEWVLKPTAGSYGRDVVRFADPQSGRRALSAMQAQYPDAYLILQRYLPAILDGETRTLVAGGEIIGSYRRKPVGDFRANLAQQGEALPTCLSSDETDLVATLAADLARLGAGFAAIDTVYPYLMEVNVANPGGLETLAGLGAPQLAAQVVSAVTRWKGL